ncbi:MAG TPA: FkbM family methyltransferase, partial [Acidimicrobiia bacterium]|nr:FkbM family methyltransferase [Acidimicrobiia bacterium]
MTVNASAVPASRWRNLEGPSGRTVPILVGEEFDALGVALSVGMFSYSEAYRFLFDFLEPGATVLDLGAHIGTFTLAAASLGCRVVAFEAAPRNVSLLEASVAANQFDLVTVVAAAVAAEPGTLRFRPEGAFGQVSDNPELGDLVEVDAVTVPEALSRLGISSVDAIKIDIEGSEPAALDGMASLLDEETAPVLVIEGNAHTLRHFGHTPEDVLARTEALGYRNLLFHAGQLVEVTPRSVQPRTVVDYLAIRRPD